MGLAVGHLVTGDDGGERAGRQRGDEHVGQGAPGHGDEGARDARLTEGLEQLAGTRPPRHVLAHAADDAAEQLVDDLDRGERDPARGR